MATVLVVDDRASNRNLISTLLSYRGHQIVEADNGAMALDLIQKSRPDLIIADLLMPFMDGFEMVRRLRNDRNLADLKVIFCTATYNDVEARRLANACGVIDLVEKPLEPESFLRLVDEVLTAPAAAVATQSTEELGFDKNHMALLRDKLADKVSELEELNALLECKVQARTVELSNSNQELQKEVAQRIEAESSLKKNRDDKLRLKDEFLSHVSHELRSPLTAVHQFATLLNDGLAGQLSHEQSECTEAIVRNVDELRFMIDDLLEVTRLQAGKLTARPGYVWLPAIFGAKKRNYSHAASARNVKIYTELADDLPPLFADASRFKQILVNLIDNSLKFTPEHGSIVLGAKLNTDQDFVEISVRDTGCGIPADQLPLIFDRLHQVPGGQESRKGLGLGLHICKELVRLQGGRIWACSEPSVGTEITFTLPVFSLSRLIDPILHGEKSLTEPISLFTINIVHSGEIPLGNSKELEELVGPVLERCILPDLDILLPSRHKTADGEIFYLIARAASDGAEVLRQRICKQLERAGDLKSAAVVCDVSFETFLFPGEAQNWSHGERLAYITARLEEGLATKSRNYIQQGSAVV